MNSVAENTKKPLCVSAHYNAVGRNFLSEPIVLLHGWGGDSRTWEPLLPLLRSFSDVITIDLPGFGQSPPSDDYSLATVMRLLLESLPDRAVYLGWSLGGALATALAASYPERVSGLITLASNLRFAAGDAGVEAMAESVFQDFSAAFDHSAPATLKRFCGLVAQGDRDERQMLKRLRQLNATCSARSAEAENDNWSQALRLLGDIDNTSAIAQVSVPGLHLFAEADALVPVTAAKKYACPGQRVKVIADSCHALHWSQPERVANAVRDFLVAGQRHLDKRKIAASFSRAATTYDAVARLQRQVGETLLSSIEEESPSRILDLGSGTGFFSAQLTTRFPQVEFMGLDIAEGMLHFARETQQLDGCWLCADAESLPLATDSVDLIFSSLSIQWCENLSALLGEVRRVLKPGGKAYLSTLGPRTLQELRQAWQAVDGYTHVNRFVAEPDFKVAINKAGLQLHSWQLQDCLLQYRDLADLLHELKALGAHNVNRDQSHGLTGRESLRRLREAYEGCREQGFLPATYEVYCMALTAEEM